MKENNERKETNFIFKCPGISGGIKYSKSHLAARIPHLETQKKPSIYLKVKPQKFLLIHKSYIIFRYKHYELSKWLTALTISQLHINLDNDS